MTTKVRPIPDGFHGAVPYLCCRNAAEAIEFYKKAFRATEVMRLAEPGGRIGHAELRIGEALIMISDEHPEMDVRSPQTLGGTPVRIHLYVNDVDALASEAVAAGVKVLIPIGDQFYGDRSGRLENPFGHVWIVSTHKEDVTPAEMQKRYEAMMKQ